MHLYFNGDSFVAGIELGDDILPDYPGMCVDLPNREAPAKLTWYQESIENPEIRGKYHSEIFALEQERCFASQAAKMLNMPYKNGARGGASHDRIARTTITDLIEIRNKYPKEPIYAFIGTTTIERSEIPNTPDIWNEELWYDVTFTKKIREPEDAGLVMKFKVKHETVYHSLMNFYKNIVLLRDFCHNTNIYLYFISTTMNYSKFGKGPTYRDKEGYLNLPDLKLWQEYADINYAIDMFEVKEKLIGVPAICPGGHWGKPVHDEVAKMIVKIVGGQ